MSVNKVILVGHLGADPETRQTGGGTTVATLRLATSERVKRGDQWEDHTEWHRIACFGRTAENAGKYLRKGRQVYVEGKIRTKKWTDKDGQDRWSTEILADTIHFLGSGNGQRSSEDRQRDDSEREPGDERDTGNNHSGGASGSDDDIPF